MIPYESNLATAGRLLFLEIVVCIALSFVAVRFGLPGRLVFIVVWLLNLVTSIYLFKAARAQEKLAWLYGMFSALGIPFSLISFIKLRINQVLSNV